jgi:hypothetical protein
MCSAIQAMIVYTICVGVLAVIGVFAYMIYQVYK